MTTPGLLPGFSSFATHHCVTGSMLHVLRHAGIDVSEEMLLGLGEGVGFFYWHQKGTNPMLLGRGNVHRPGVAGLEIDACRRLGVHVVRSVTTSAKKAQSDLEAELAAGRPVMVQLDMGHLPYLDLPDDYHFGGHVVVVAGDRDDHVWVADRDEELHLVPTELLAAARGSKSKPFPPINTWYRFDTRRARPLRTDELRAAIAANADAMLHGPITNLGVRGIRKAARLVPGWPRMLPPDGLRDTCLNAFIMIDATGGTGGGLFRAMYGRFLGEASVLLGAPELEAAGEDMGSIAAEWDAAAQIFRAVGEGEAAPALEEVGAKLRSIADREQALWSALAAWVR